MNDNKLIKNFESWRNKTITEYENNCMGMEESVIQNSKEAKDDFINFTRCMIQLTRQICMCDQKCLAKSFENVQYHSVCPRIEVNNLFLSRNYLDCQSYGIKIVGGDMINKNAKSIYTDFLLRMKYLTTNLCFNEENSFEALQCAAYELKDECKEDVSCVETNFPSLKFYSCQNDDFEYHLKEIGDTIDLKGLNTYFDDQTIKNNEEPRIRRKIRSAGDTNDFYDVQNLKKIESQNLINLETAYYISFSALIILGIGYLFARRLKKISVNTNSQDLENN